MAGPGLGSRSGKKEISRHQFSSQSIPTLGHVSRGRIKEFLPYTRRKDIGKFPFQTRKLRHGVESGGLGSQI